jgi:hypothetical protein
MLFNVHVDISHNEKIVFDVPKRNLNMKVDQNLSSQTNILYEKYEQLSYRIDNYACVDEG